MNFQQVVQPKSAANGFGRRPRSENKLQSGRSNPNRSSNADRAVAGGKGGVIDGPSRDRLVYLTTCLMGHQVEVQVKNGSVYSGTCYTTNIEKEFGIVLKMARMIKDASSRGQKADFVSKAPTKTLIIPGKDVVQVVAKDVFVTTDGISNELQCERPRDIMLDSFISQSRHVEAERELEPWVPDADDPQYSELENVFDGPWNRGWNQFETNEILFGVKSTFDEELYTTKLERGPKTRDLEREAMRIAREIEGEDTQDLHLAEERGIHLHESFDVDEETRFSSVYRGRTVDDCGYEEVEDVILDSRNSETFGDSPASLTKKTTDLTYGNINDEARLVSSSSLDEAECSQSSTSVDLYQLESYDNASQLASELPVKSFSSSDSRSRILENLDGEHVLIDSIKEPVERQTLLEHSQLPNIDDSPSGQKDEVDKEGSSPNATPYDPSSNVSSQSNEKTNSPIEGAVLVKGAGEAQSTNSRGRPGSSTSSSSDRVGAASASSGPGLSPSSSAGSLVSQKSTLNPHAKEFKLNPNAKSFTPSQGPVRPPSPVSDSSFYFPAVSTVPHLHGLPMAIGIGPSSFTGQPVILSPQVAPLQTPQTYFPPGAPQYGQQVLHGPPHRPYMYMQSYQPEMPYKGRQY